MWITQSRGLKMYFITMEYMWINYRGCLEIDLNTISLYVCELNYPRVLETYLIAIENRKWIICLNYYRWLWRVFWEIFNTFQYFRCFFLNSVKDEAYWCQKKLNWNYGLRRFMISWDEKNELLIKTKHYYLCVFLQVFSKFDKFKFSKSTILTVLLMFKYKFR